MNTGRFRNHLAALILVILAIGLSRSEAVIMTKGKFKILEVSPWKIEIIEGLEGHEEHTGLPLVTPDKWICRGAAPTEADMGKVFEFEGYIPDIGGVYGFVTEDEVFHFRSKWSAPFQEAGADAVKREGLVKKLGGRRGLLLLAVVTLIVGVIVARSAGRNAGS